MPVALRDKWPTDLTASKGWFQATAGLASRAMDLSADRVRR